MFYLLLLLFIFNLPTTPKKIEHILFGFTGNIGKDTMRVADTVTGDKKAALPPADCIPLVGSFFRISYRNPKIINDCYEQLDAQTKWYNEYKLTGGKLPFRKKELRLLKEL